MEDGGLTGKYVVERADGRPSPSTARFFVLNYASDPYARTALRAYAEACAETHPTLAADLHGAAAYFDALAKQKSRNPEKPVRGQQGSGAAPATDEALLALVARRAAEDPALAAELRAAADAAD